MSAEREAVTRVISDYARSWSLLQGYDEQVLGEINLNQLGVRIEPDSLSESRNPYLRHSANLGTVFV